MVTLWWVANAVLFLVVIPAVLVIAVTVLRPALSIKRYADDILSHGVGLTAEADGLARLEATRQRVETLRGMVVGGGGPPREEGPPPWQVAAPSQPQRGGTV